MINSDQQTTGDSLRKRKRIVLTIISPLWVWGIYSLSRTLWLCDESINIGWDAFKVGAGATGLGAIPLWFLNLGRGFPKGSRLSSKIFIALIHSLIVIGPTAAYLFVYTNKAFNGGAYTVVEKPILFKQVRPNEKGKYILFKQTHDIAVFRIEIMKNPMDIKYDFSTMPQELYDTVTKLRIAYKKGYWGYYTIIDHQLK